MADSVKGFAELHVDLCEQPFPHLPNGSIIGHQVGQARPSFHEPMLAVPDPPVVPHMPCDHIFCLPGHFCPGVQ